MFNLYCTHMYRARKALSTKILAIILLVSVFLMLGLAFLIYDDPLNMMAAGMVTATQTGTTAGISLDTTPKLTPPMVHSFFVQGNSCFIILLTIFAVIFINADYSNGFIKNVYGLYSAKWKFIWAKWTALVTTTTIVYVIYSFLSLLLAMVLKSFRAGKWDDYCMSFVMTYVLLVAMVTMVFFITSLFKSPAGGMVIGLVIASGILQTIEHLLDMLIAKLCGANMEEMIAAFMGLKVEGVKSYFAISDYCLDNVYLTYSSSWSQSDTIRALFVGLGYSAVFLGLTMYWARKKDLR